MPETAYDMISPLWPSVTRAVSRSQKRIHLPQNWKLRIVCHHCLSSLGLGVFLIVMNDFNFNQRRKKKTYCKSIIYIVESREIEDGNFEYLVGFHDTFEPISNLNEECYHLVNALEPGLMPINNVDPGEASVSVNALHPGLMPIDDIGSDEASVYEPNRESEIDLWEVNSIAAVRKNRKGYECLVKWAERWVSHSLIPPAILKAFDERNLNDSETIATNLTVTNAAVNSVERTLQSELIDSPRVPSVESLASDQRVEQLLFTCIQTPPGSETDCELGVVANEETETKSADSDNVESANSENSRLSPTNSQPEPIHINAITTNSIHQIAALHSAKTTSQSEGNLIEFSCGPGVHLLALDQPVEKLLGDCVQTASGSKTDIELCVVTNEGPKKKSSPSPDKNEITGFVTRGGIIKKFEELSSDQKKQLIKKLQFIGDKPKMKMVECNICQKKFSTTRKLNLHEKIHLGLKFKCEEPDCGKMFSIRAKLSSHIKREHGRVMNPTEKQGKKDLAVKAGKLKCEICGDRFSRKFTLNRHTLAQHSAFECFICRTTFANSIQLKNHLHVQCTASYTRAQK